jgi:hypothetical protein
MDVSLVQGNRNRNIDREVTMKTVKAKKTGKAKVVAVGGVPGDRPKQGKRPQTKAKNVVAIDSVAAITHEQIARRAWSIWMSQGCVPGHDEEHWLQAERELICERKQS